MPYPNEHSARIRSPKGFDSIRRQNNKFGRGIHVLFGIKAGTSEVQAIRFDKKLFTAAKAKAWLKKHGYKPMGFEAAIVTKGERGIVQRLKGMVGEFMENLDSVSEEDRALDIWQTSLTTLQKEILAVYEEAPKGEHRYTIQRCCIGKSMYDILNLAIGDGRIIRWALLSGISGAQDIPIITLKGVDDRADVEVEDARACVPFAMRPQSWMHLRGTQPKGTLGASEEYPGVYIVLKEGKLEFGAQLPYLHEYVLDGKRFVVQLEVEKSEIPIPASNEEITLPLWTFKPVVEAEKGVDSGRKLVLKGLVAQTEPEYVVGGIVHTSDFVDLQGDIIEKEEIWKMMKHFMLHGRQFSVEHNGRRVDLPIIESFLAEEDTIKGGEPLPAGSFWLSVSLAEEQGVYKDVESGVLTGWSIEGLAHGQKVGDE